jgi:hypothetical protein
VEYKQTVLLIRYQGNPSIFSTITSAGGGGGVYSTAPAPLELSRWFRWRSRWFLWSRYPGGTGNTPPVSPSQGNPGGNTTYKSC